MEQKKSEVKNMNLVEKIGNWMVEGNRRSEVIELIKRHSPEKLTNVQCIELIEEAKEVLAKSCTDHAEIIRTHIAWYEEFYQYLKSIDHIEGANKALAAKERLLNLTGAANKVTINRNTQINVARPVPQYDETKLTLQQRERLHYLLEKGKA